MCRGALHCSLNAAPPPHPSDLIPPAVRMRHRRCAELCLQLHGVGVGGSGKSIAAKYLMEFKPP